MLLALPCAAQDDPIELIIDVKPGLRFGVPRLQIPANAPVKLTLDNTDQMMHNLVIAKPGTRLSLVQEALALGDKGPEMQFVPDSPNVLWKTKVLAPGERQTLEFTSPEEPGVYPYVCTYPGHGLFMFGALYVGDQQLPSLDEDPHVPPKFPEPKTASPFLIPVDGAKVVREFMPDCGPAAIAIGMPNGISACWDAGTCELRYVWSGGFIEIPYRKNDRAKIIGKVFSREAPGSGLRIGDSETREADFLGYRLIDSFPEFRYRLNGIEVREKIHLNENGDLTQSFRIEETDLPIRYGEEGRAAANEFQIITAIKDS